MTPTSFPYLRADYWSIEIERLRRERDALLREHEAVTEMRNHTADGWLDPKCNDCIDAFNQLYQAHDEAARVLSEGAKQ